MAIDYHIQTKIDEVDEVNIAKTFQIYMQRIGVE